ncbi:MAG: PhoX family phosphatase [Kofleriaceae bacterium]
MRTSRVVSAVFVVAACGDSTTIGPSGPPGPTGPTGGIGDPGTDGANGANGTNGASCPMSRGVELESEGVPGSAPLSSIVALTFCDAAHTGATNVADYVKALVGRYNTNSLEPGFEFPLTPAATDTLRAIRGLVPDVVVKWMDPLTWDNMTSPTLTPRLGANADFIAYFGDGWQDTPYWNGSDTAGWMWVNHEYVSNNRPKPTAAPTGQMLTLARFLSYWGMIQGSPTSNTWSPEDLAVFTDAAKQQVGGTWMRVVRDPATGEWSVDRTQTARRYDATDATLVKVNSLDVSADTDDQGTPLPDDVVVGVQGNCSGTMTPWGTIITAEENVATSYGDLEVAWSSGNRFQTGRGFDPGANVSFDTTPSPTGEFTSGAAAHPKDAYGFLVEIDPGKEPGEYYGKTTAGVGHRKLGSVGRANWENAAFAVGIDSKLIPNQPIVMYAGNDRRSGHIYKFVTTQSYTAGMTKPQIRALLDSGKLYFSHFTDLDNTQGRRMMGGGATPTEAAPGVGRWIELSTTSTDVAPNASGLGAPTKTVGAALTDVNWNGIGGFPTDVDIRKALFTASLKIGAMELNRPEDIEYSPHGYPGGTTPRLYVSFTNHTGTVALDQAGVLLPNATPQPNRGDRGGGIFAIEELVSATPASSTTFKFWQVWQGNMTGLLFDAGSPDNLVIDREGGVWFGTDGYFGSSGKKTADAIYYLDLDPTHKTTSSPSYGLAFRIAATPSDAEATGPQFAPSMTSMFFSVQHPGEDQQSSWPPR